MRRRNGSGAAGAIDIGLPSRVEDRITAAIADEEARVRDAYSRRSNAARYSWFNAAHVYAMQQVERELLRGLRRHGFDALADQRVLEVGCGSAVWLREFVKWGAQPARLAGVDLLDDRIARARTVSPADFRLIAGSAAALDFADGSFDILVQSLMFTSIIDAKVRRRVASEMLRVVRADGLIVWYDYRLDNPRNPDVRGVGAREITELFPMCRIERRRMTLAPPLARAIAPRSKAAYAILSAIPLLNTHYLAFIRAPQRLSTDAGVGPRPVH